MSSDRARISFDPSRAYRSVISQQGRVTIEADINEATAIAGAARRAELLDIIGPSGTPDDGYGVGAGPAGSAAGDLSISAGTFYVGGERVELVQPLDYAQQPDWIDAAGDPLWTAPAVPSGEVVYLLLREQEVSAVEDPALVDIALGGPDTSGRTRILQRVVRLPTAATDAAGSLAALEQAWTSIGLSFDPETMRLTSRATLQVGFGQTPAAASLCQPSGQGGYVGAENQLIRVQVASVSDGVPTLVWGYDNASFLYRVAGAQLAGATILTLASAPVDSYHQPASGQAVEILQAAGQLDPSDTADYVAASTGTVTTLAAPYDSSAQQVQLATGLTAEQAASPLLFLRVWEEMVTYSSGPVALGQTGLQVTLANPGGTWHVGDYWTFAVRPGTPNTMSPVYPERILTAPQPPDGPSLWAAQLALVNWSGGTPSFTDLRNRFVDLVALTEQAKGCCTVEITPDAVDGGAGLQALIDSYAGLGPTTICFQPGTYTLPAPLVVKAGAAALTLEACMGGVVIEAAANSAPFTLGLIVAQAAGPSAGSTTTTAATTTTAGGTAAQSSTPPLDETVTELEDVAPLTIRGMVLSLPPIAFSFSPSAIGGLPAQREALLTGYGNGLVVAIGISVFGCSEVTIEECSFYFPDVGTTNLFGAGIYATGTTAGMIVRDCSFVQVPEPESAPFSDMRLGTLSAPPYQACFGYLQMPTSPPDATTTPAPITTTEALRTAYVPPTLAESTISTIDPSRGTIFFTTAGPPPTTSTTTTTTTTTAAPTTTSAPPAPLTLDDAVLEDAIFTRNTFDGLTVPVLVLAQIGAASVTDNIVRACYGGFWFIPGDGDTAVALLDLLDSTDASASSYAVQYGISALTDPVLWLATALARLLPLTPPSVAAGPSLREIALPPSLLPRAANLLQLISSGTTTTTTTTTSAPAGAAATAERLTEAGAGPPTEEITEASRNLAGETETVESDTGLEAPSALRLTGGRLAGFEPVDTLGGETAIRPIDIAPRMILPTFGDLIGITQATAPAPPVILSADMGLGTTPRLDFHGNQVEAIIESTYSGVGLLVAVMLTDGTIASLLCNGNRIRGRATACPVVSINQITQCTMTGNIISNEIPEASAGSAPEASVTPASSSSANSQTPTTTSPSLVLEPSSSSGTPAAAALVAVTGNVLIGDPPTLPARPAALPAGFTVWDALNTITSYVAPPTTTTTTSTTTTSG